MLSRHRLDTTTRFDGSTYESLPDTQLIEYPEEVDVSGNPLPPYAPHTVAKEPYLSDGSLVEAVNLAITLRRPLLLQGDPGCGKTRLAYAVAYALKLPVEECYIKSTSRAQDLLYTYDAVKRLYDAQLGQSGIPGYTGSTLPIGAVNYIKLGPLGRAIARAQLGYASVVLIDEIDKADLDFPNDLLRELDRLEFEITEAPGMRYAAGENLSTWPILFVTHNEEKALPAAFLRRCIFHYVRFPEDPAQLKRILDLHATADTTLTDRAVDVLLRLRQMDLTKSPGLSELLDWVNYLKAVQTPAEDLDKLPYLGTLLKQQIDQTRARQEFEQS